MKAETGRKAVETARGLVGAHYLWGTRGEIPGVREALPIFKGRAPTELVEDGRRLDPLPAQPVARALAVFAAESSASGSLCVCAGRWRAITGGRWTDPNAADLLTYLATLRAVSVPFWQPYFLLFSPRRPFGPGTKSEVYWGEICQHRRHFDCIGFVNWCVWKATGIPYTFDIAQWSAGTAGGQVFKLAMSGPSSLLDGDVIVKANHHIGLVSQRGEIIEAQEPATGVCVSGAGAFNLKAPGTWTHLIRLPQ